MRTIARDPGSPEPAARPPATLRFKGAAVFGRLVARSGHGAEIELGTDFRPMPGEWVVLASGGFGNDARVVRAEGRRWHLSFDTVPVAESAVAARLPALPT